MEPPKFDAPSTPGLAGPIRSTTPDPSLGESERAAAQPPSLLFVDGTSQRAYTLATWRTQFVNPVETAVLRVAEALTSEFDVTVAHGGASLPVSVGGMRFVSLAREAAAPTRRYDLVVSVAALRRSSWRSLAPRDAPWIAWTPGGLDAPATDLASFLDAGGRGVVASNRAALEKVESIVGARAGSRREVIVDRIEDPIDDLLVPYSGLAIRDRVGVELNTPYDAVATWAGLERLHESLPGARIVVLARGEEPIDVAVPSGIEVVDVSREAAFIREARSTCVVVDLSPAAGAPLLTNRRLLAAIGVPVTRSNVLATRWRECEDTTELSVTLTVPEIRPEMRLGIVTAAWTRLVGAALGVSPS